MGAVDHACEHSASRATRHTVALRGAATCARGGSGQSSYASRTSSETGVSTDRRIASNEVERLMNHLKQHRRVATRYEKRAANYRAMLSLACILLWL